MPASKQAKKKDQFFIKKKKREKFILKFCIHKGEKILNISNRQIRNIRKFSTTNSSAHGEKKKYFYTRKKKKKKKERKKKYTKRDLTQVSLASAAKKNSPVLYRVHCPRRFFFPFI